MKLVRILVVVGLLGCGRFGFTSSAATDGSATARDAVATDSYSTAVLADHPIAYWRFDEPSGTTAHDEVGGHDGTYNGGCTLGVPGALTSPDAAVAFDGTTCYVDVGDQLSLGGDAAFTIELWANNALIDGSVRWLVSFDVGSGSNTGYDLPLQQPMTVWFEEDNSGTSLVYIAATAPALGQFHHLAVTATSTRQRIYIDGVLATERTFNATPPVTPGTLVFGHFARYLDAGTNFFTGVMDDLAYYDAELTAGQLAAHVAAR